MNALATNTNSKINIAIIQTTRIGDLLQTAHAVKLLKENHPEFYVTLVARKQFASPIMFLLEKTFDNIVQIEHKSLVDNSSPLSTTILNLKNEIKRITQREIDVSINLSFSKSSTYLHTLLDARKKVGPYFNSLHERVINDKWSQYLYATVMRGELNPINLVDLFANIIGVKKKMTHLTNNDFSSEKKSKILIHPFASNEKKQWKVNRWVEIVYQTLKKNEDVNIYICGAKGDLENAKAIVNSSLIEKFKDRIHLWIGHKLEDLYRNVDEKFLFVGHDSMVGNLLSFKNVKSLTVSLGTVRAHETTPYALENFNLSPKTGCFPCFPTDKCSDMKCHNDVPYNITYQCIEQLLNSNDINTDKLKESCSTLSLSRVNLYKSNMLSNGDLTVKEVLHKEHDAKEIIRNFYHITWSSLLNESSASMDIPNLTTEAKQQLKHHANGIESLFELAEFGKKYSRYILEEVSKNTPSLEEIKNYSAKLDEVDRLTDLLSQTFPLFAPVIDFAKVSKNNLAGDNIVTLSESAFYVYNESSLACSVLYEFFEKCSLIERDVESQRKNI